MIDTSKWQKLERTGLSAEKVEQLIYACAAAHSEFISVGLACGIRAAFRMLGEMGGDRAKHTIDRASMRANGCVAIAFMVITCVNTCKGSLDFTDYRGSDWQVSGWNQLRRVDIRMKEASFADTAAVFAAADEELFDEVKVSEIAADEARS